MCVNNNKLIFFHSGVVTTTGSVFAGPTSYALVIQVTDGCNTPTETLTINIQGKQTYYKLEATFTF